MSVDVDDMSDEDFLNAMEELTLENESDVGELLKAMNENHMISWEEAERILADTSNEPVKCSLVEQTRPTEPDNDTNVDRCIQQLQANDPNLKQINLNNMKLRRLIEAMAYNEHLEKLSLANMGLYDNDVAVLIEAIRLNQNLKHLNLETNYLSGDFFHGLFEAASENESLEEIKAVNQGVSFSTEAEKNIIRAIQKNHALCKVSLTLRLPEGRHKIEQTTLRNGEIRRILRRKQREEEEARRKSEPAIRHTKPSRFEQAKPEKELETQPLNRPKVQLRTDFLQQHEPEHKKQTKTDILEIPEKKERKKKEIGLTEVPQDVKVQTKIDEDALKRQKIAELEAIREKEREEERKMEEELEKRREARRRIEAELEEERRRQEEAELQLAKMREEKEKLRMKKAEDEKAKKKAEEEKLKKRAEDEKAKKRVEDERAARLKKLEEEKAAKLRAIKAEKERLEKEDEKEAQKKRAETEKRPKKAVRKKEKKRDEDDAAKRADDEKENRVRRDRTIDLLDEPLNLPRPETELPPAEPKVVLPESDLLSIRERIRAESLQGTTLQKRSSLALRQEALESSAGRASRVREGRGAPVVPRLVGGLTQKFEAKAEPAARGPPWRRQPAAASRSPEKPAWRSADRPYTVEQAAVASHLREPSPNASALPWRTAKSIGKSRSPRRRGV